MRPGLLAVLGWGARAAAKIKAALSHGSGANKVTVTAKTAGVAGNSISLTVSGVAHVYDAAKALQYSEAGNDMTVQLATTDAVARKIRLLIPHADPAPDSDFLVTAVVKGAAGNALAVTAAAGGALAINEASYPDIVLTYVAGDTDVGDMVAFINANATKITAQEGEHPEQVMAGIDSTESVVVGSDSALAGTTTVQLQGAFSNSTLVDATGGSTGSAAALTQTQLAGGVG